MLLGVFETKDIKEDFRTPEKLEKKDFKTPETLEKKDFRKPRETMK